MRLHKAEHIDYVRTIYQKSRVTFGLTYFSLSELEYLIEADEIDIKEEKVTTDSKGQCIQIRLRRHGHSTVPKESCIFTIRIQV